jgi:hypothetical protein
MVMPGLSLNGSRRGQCRISPHQEVQPPSRLHLLPHYQASGRRGPAQAGDAARGA